MSEDVTWGLLIEYMGDFLSRGNSWLIKKVVQGGFPPLLRFHQRELREKLSNMPFIYRDLKTEILTDFVDIEFDTLTLASLQSRPAQHGQLDTARLIDVRHRALFIGNAGTGKTTFFRRRALTGAGDAVPFYVPLKAVNSLAEHPILNFLLQNYLYLRGGRGLHRLLRLAKKGRMLLLLDGYDEVYLPPQEQKDYLREELELIFSPAFRPKEFCDFPPLVRSVYEHLKICKVWLSSRREFYQQNPLSLNEDIQRRTGRLDFVAVSIKGLNDRAALVRKIFDIYRERAPRIAGVLDEEALLHKIDGSEDRDLIRLSFNPLFLTVICYIHAQELLNHKRSWQDGSMAQLLSTCVDLLLEDVDEYKITDLHSSRQSAFRERRLRYVDEEREFLPYFATFLLGRETAGVSVFYQEDLESAIVDFFSHESRSSRAPEIIESLRSRRNKHRFDRQLLNKGLFLAVGTSERGIQYDFPHRRFREVLAAQYLDKPGKIEEVMATIGSKRHSEFLYVFFGVTRHQDKIMREILKHATTRNSREFYGRLALNCLQRKPDEYDATMHLETFFKRCVSDDLEFYMPKAIIKYITPRDDFMIWTARELRNSLIAGDARVTAIVGPIILELNRPLMRETLDGVGGTVLAENDNMRLTHFLRLAGLTDKRLFISLLHRCRGDIKKFRAWSAIALRDVGIDFADLFPHVESLTLVELASLLAASQAYNPAIATEMAKMPNLANETELLTVLLKELKPSKRRGVVARETTNERKNYVITSRIVKGVRDEGTRERLRSHAGKLISTESKLSFLPDDIREGVLTTSKVDSHLLRDIAQVLETGHPAVDLPTYFY